MVHAVEDFVFVLMVIVIIYLLVRAVSFVIWGPEPQRL